jgi:hypothetical protein
VDDLGAGRCGRAMGSFLFGHGPGGRHLGSFLAIAPISCLSLSLFRLDIYPAQSRISFSLEIISIPSFTFCLLPDAYPSSVFEVGPRPSHAYLPHSQP